MGGLGIFLFIFRFFFSSFLSKSHILLESVCTLVGILNGVCPHGDTLDRLPREMKCMALKKREGYWAFFLSFLIQNVFRNMNKD